MPKKRHWIKGAVKHPGAFRAAAERAGETTAQFAREHEQDSGTLGDRARLAETLMGMHHKPKSNQERAKSRYGKG